MDVGPAGLKPDFLRIDPVMAAARFASVLVRIGLTDQKGLSNL
jgi:hypothetical protein